MKYQKLKNKIINKNVKLSLLITAKTKNKFVLLVVSLVWCGVGTLYSGSWLLTSLLNFFHFDI